MRDNLACMVSFFSKLFGGAGKASDGAGAPNPDKAVEYQGLTIVPAPQSDGGQWRLAGEIIKGSGEDAQRHRFVRADTFSSRDEAEDFAIRKARQIIDERGGRLFADGAASGHV